MEEIYGRDNLLQLLYSWHDGICEFHEKGLSATFETCLEKVACPALIVQGGKDPVTPFRQAEFLKNHIQNSRYIFK